MAEGFLVDLGALDAAATGIVDTMDQMATRRVEELQLAGDVGHRGLADMVGQFCRRWNIGVTNLEADVDSVVSRLVECVSAYRQTDEAVQAGFAGVIQRETGDDPGMG
jgi:hypothetical protein